MKHFAKRWTIGYTAVLLIFSLYAILDTFVISSVYTVVEQEQSGAGQSAGAKTAGGQETKEYRQQTDTNDKKRSSLKGKAKVYAREQESTESATKTKRVQDTGAESKISLTEYREHDTDIYVAQIDASTVTALRTAFAQNAYGRNVTATTSQIAENAGAVLAINGDYYGAREKGYVIRNGVLYREEGQNGQEDLVVWQDGSFSVIKEGEVTAQELVAQGAWQVWSFGPALIVDGEISVGVNDEVDRAMRANPRTAIGILENGDYVMVVSDGRTNESNGLSLYELAEFMESLGAVTAYNLDGGGSSTMVYNGELVNQPTTTGRIKERAVSDIIYISF